MRYASVKLHDILKLVEIAIKREDHEMCQCLAEMVSQLTDLEIWDYAREGKVCDDFDDQDFENKKAVMLEFRENYLFGEGFFDLEGIFKNRPTLDDLFK